MANITTRSSALALKEETTEGTPVAPAAAGDYVKLQDDFSMEPAFEVLENAEAASSIGASKPILGSESPTASFSHYIRGSAVEGQAPNYGVLMKSLFGTEHVRSTERDTVAGSTTSVLNVDTGEGSEFARGHMLLIKDGTNGYRARFVHSVSSDALTLGFQVGNAPASGVNLGKGVSYLPADASHPTLSVWHYLGNQGAIQMMSGARVASASVDISAGQLINANYSLEGLEYYFDPITIDSTNKYIDFNDGGVQVAALTEKTYKNPHDLADEIASKMDAQSSDTITCTYSDSTGKFTITSDGVSLSLLWNTGTNTANGAHATIGFSSAADDTGATTYVSDNAQDYSSPQTASYDDADPLAAKGHEVMVGDDDDYACFSPSTVSISFDNTRAVEPDICATSGQGGSLFSARAVTISISALLQQYDSDKFDRFINGLNVRFQSTHGLKSGGNWIAGKTVGFYCPTATISSVSIDDLDGQAQLNMELTAYVNSSGEGEFYFGQV